MNSYAETTEFQRNKYNAGLTNPYISRDQHESAVWNYDPIAQIHKYLYLNIRVVGNFL